MSANHAQIIQELDQIRQTGDAAALRLRLRETVTRNLHAPETVHQLGLAAAQWGELDDAIAILQDCANLSPNCAAVHNDLGVMYHSSQRLLDASNAFQRALACEPDFKPALANLLSIKVQALLGLAQAELEEGKTAKATERLNEVLRVQPDNDAARNLLDRVAKRTRTPEQQTPRALLLPERTLRAYRLRAVFQEIVLICVQHELPRWWDYHKLYSIFQADSAQLARRLLREFVLRRAGDHRAFLRLSRELDVIGSESSAQDRFVAQLAQRFEVELQQMKSLHQASAGKPFVLAFPVWGKSYIDRFLDCCMPSLLALGNLPALCERRAPILLIHTDAEGERMIREAPVMREVMALGISLHFMPLDSQLLARLGENPDNKYWHLGLVQTLQLLFAKAIGADFHILLPDTLYAENYFRTLSARADAGNPVILQAAFRTEAEKVERAVAQYRSGYRTTVDAGTLMAIALNCLHPSTHYLRMNDRPAPNVWPAFHALLWESETSLHFISPHQTVGYLDASLVARVPERFYLTTDSELDKILPDDCAIYSPRAEDGLTLIELSPGAVEPGRGRMVDRQGFVDQFWHAVESRRHLKFFDQDIVFPIAPSRRHVRHVLSTQQIASEQGEIRSMVRDAYPVSPPLAVVNGLLSLHAAETHPLAQARVPHLREAARAIWLSGYQSITPESPMNLVYQVVRMLWHFDLLPEAHECLQRYPMEGGLRKALDDWQGRQDPPVPTPSRHSNACFVIGITVWGQSYLDFFADFHLPALLAKGNLPWLAHHGRVVFSIVTDSAGREFLEQAPSMQSLAQLAELRFVVTAQVPQRTTAAERQTFYMRYGLLDHHHVALARKLSANLVMLPPDVVISRAGLQALWQEIANGFDCCTVACIEANRDAVLPELAALRNGTQLAVEANVLAQIAVRHKTDYFRSLVVNPHRRLNAHPREFFWRVPDGYVCKSLFMHPIMLSARVLSRPFHPDYHNVDWALLPRLLQGESRVKVLGDSSGLFILHCSDHQVRANEASEFNGELTPKLGEYLLSVHQHDFPIHRELFTRSTFFCVDDADEPVNEDYLTDVAVLESMFQFTFPRVVK
jgi:tetratricopeptide (TPR) repeat protein